MEGKRSHQSRGNTKIKPSHAFQCFSPGVDIRTLSQFGSGIQLFFKMLVCSVNSDIFLTAHVAYVILSRFAGTQQSNGHCPLSKT